MTTFITIRPTAEPQRVLIFDNGVEVEERIIEANGGAVEFYVNPERELRISSVGQETAGETFQTQDNPEEEPFIKQDELGSTDSPGLKRTAKREQLKLTGAAEGEPEQA